MRLDSIILRLESLSEFGLRVGLVPLRLHDLLIIFESVGVNLELLLEVAYLVLQLDVLLCDGDHVHLVLELVLQLPLQLLHLLVHLEEHSRIAIS